MSEIMDVFSKVDQSFKKHLDNHKVKISGITYEFSPPTTKDEFIMLEKVRELRENKSLVSEAIPGIRVRAIATMLRSINGVYLPEVIENPQTGKKQERVLFLSSIIDKWPAAVVSSLYLVVNDVKERFRKEVHKDINYDWFGEDMIKKEEEAEAAYVAKIAEEERAISLKKSKMEEIEESPKEPKEKE